MKTTIHKSVEPFPHLIVRGMYLEEELKLIWQELDFLTHASKLGDPDSYGGASENGRYLTNAKALILDNVYSNRDYSNILQVNRKLFTQGFLEIFSELSPFLNFIINVNWDLTKIRYYQDEEFYEPHTDYCFSALAVTYFHREPKLFSGGTLIFPSHNYTFDCEHNSMILFPGHIEHSVEQIKTNEPPYSGGSRYCMTQFLHHVLK